MMGERTARSAAALISVCAFAATAAGHSFAVYSGRIKWDESELRIEVDFTPHLLFHESRAQGEVVEPEWLAEMLADSFLVYSATGDRFDAVGATVRDDGSGATIEFAMPAGVDTAALVHRPAGAGAMLRRQFQLRWSAKDSGIERLVRLTSDGNHAVIQRRARSGGGVASIDRFSEPVIRIDRNETGAGIRAYIDFPCTLLVTWGGFELEGVTIDGDWLREHGDRVRAWTQRNLSSGCGSGAASWRIDAIGLMTPDDEMHGARPDASAGVYATRVRVTAVIDSCGDGSGVDVSWSGFNPAVLRVPVILGFESSLLIGELTPAQRTVRVECGAVLRGSVMPEMVDFEVAGSSAIGEGHAR